MEKVAPLSGGFMAVAIAGFFISAMKVYGLDKTWGFTLRLFFGIMFVASLVSMTAGPVEDMIEMDNKKKK